MKKFDVRTYKKSKRECEVCGISENLTKHHKKKRSRGGRRIIQNIEILCRECHDRIHNISSIPKINRWTDDEADKLMKMYKEGKTYEEMAKILGRTKSSCYTMVHNVKLFVDGCSNKIRKINILSQGKSKESGK